MDSDFENLEDLAEDAANFGHNESEFRNRFIAWANALQAAIAETSRRYDCIFHRDDAQSSIISPWIEGPGGGSIASIEIFGDSQGSELGRPNSTASAAKFSFNIKASSEFISSEIERIAEVCKSAKETHDVEKSQEKQKRESENQKTIDLDQERPAGSPKPNPARSSPATRAKSDPSSGRTAQKSPESYQMRMFSPGSFSGESPRPNQSPWSNTEKVPESMKSGNNRQSMRSPDFAVAKSSGQSQLRSANSYEMKSPHCEMRSADSYSLKASSTSGGTDRQAQIQNIQNTSHSITYHEERHAAALRDVDPSAKPKIEHKEGPDGKKYAVAGQVETNVSTGGPPKTAEKKAEAVYRSAIGDQERSASDNVAARKAMFAAQKARLDGFKMKSIENGGGIGDGDRSMSTGGDEGDEMQSPSSRGGKCYSAKMSSPNGNDQGGVSMQSPQGSKVVMHNPAAAILGVIGRVIAGTVVRGGAAAAFKRGATAVAGGIRSEATNFARRGARGSAQRRFGSMIAKRAGKAGRDARSGKMMSDLQRSSEKLVRTFDELNEKARKFSPQLQIQESKNYVAQFRADQKTAREIGKPLADYSGAKSRLSIAQQDVSTTIASVMLPIYTAVTTIQAFLTEVLGTILNVITTSFKSLYDVVEGATGIVRGSLAFLEEISRYIKYIWDAMPDWMKRKEEKPKDNLNDFFTMQVPPPFAFANGFKPPVPALPVPPPLNPPGGL